MAEAARNPSPAAGALRSRIFLVRTHFSASHTAYIEAAFGVVDLRVTTEKARKCAYLDDESLDWEPSDIDFGNMPDHDPEQDD
ncbi:hypothetical protein ABGB07_41005 [Micromonosporaceae bacterium B7E4]